MINPATCTEQLLYEIHDPGRYITPDCIADFSMVELKSIGKDKVRFGKASGKESTDSYKVSVGYRHGFIGEGEISYEGTNCVARAKLAGEILMRRLENIQFSDFRVELIGLNSIYPVRKGFGDIPEVRLRVSGRAESMDQAKQIGREVEALYTNGPAAGGGVTQKTEEAISVVSVLLPKTEVQTRVIYQEN